LFDEVKAIGLIVVLCVLGLHGLFYRDADGRWPPAYILFAAIMLFYAGKSFTEKYMPYGL
jgi:hypothetical protein